MDARPDRAQDFLNELAALGPLLREQGFRCGPDRWLNLHDLLNRMDAEGRLPEAIEDLRPYLAPLFCGTRDEQVRFGKLYRNFILRKQAGRNKTQTPETPRASLKAPRYRRRIVPFLPFLGVGVLAIVVVWGWQYQSHVNYENIVRYDDLQRAVLKQAIERASTVSKDPIHVSVPLRLPAEPPVLTEEHQVWLDTTEKLIPWLPWFLLAPWLAWRYANRRFILKRQKADPRDPLSNLPLQNNLPELFDSAEVSAALRSLHVPVPQSSRALNIRATVDQTVRRAGLFSPVAGTRLSVPDVVVMLGFQHREDHTTGFGDSICRGLKAAGLAVHVYYYQNNPAWLQQKERPGRMLSVTEIASRHEGARLLIVGGSEALVDLWTTQALPWTEVLVAWPDRGLLFTGTIDPGQREVIAGQKIVLAPLSSRGLTYLGKRLSGVPAPPAPGLDFVLPRSLRDPDQWQSRIAPPEPQIAGLLNDLQDFLGASGLMLLRAMAWYPALHWELTRVLDYSLFPNSDAAIREQRLLRISRLTWCRRGWMPDWLRKALLEPLSSIQQARIRHLYREILSASEAGGKGSLALPIAGPKKPKEFWQRLRQRFSPRGRGFRLYLRDLFAGSPPESLLQDRIFANLMLGKRLGLLDFDLPRMLSKWLPGWRRWPALRLLYGSLFVGLVAWLSLPNLWDYFAKDWMQEELLNAQRREFAEIPVTIATASGTLSIAEALQNNLAQQGFEQIRISEQEKAPAGNRVVDLGGETNVIARFVAGRMAFVLYGEAGSIPVESEKAHGGTGEGRHEIRVELATPPRTGSVFRDRFVGPLTSELRASFKEKLPPKLLQTTGVIEPEMVELPGGTFRMGCVSGIDCSDDEKPVHEVTIRPFAMARYEITFEEYDAYAKDQNKTLPDDFGWGRGKRPVIHVSWQDAKDYAAWLSQKTGKSYRLPSEAEWEYAARGGTETPYWWGKDIREGAKVWANCWDCGSEWDRKQTAPVGQFPSNPYRLNDTAGNVWEWTEDCWHSSYQGAPEKGRSWGEENGGDCSSRVVRGGGWFDKPQFLRSASRDWLTAVVANYSLGFRLARTN
ncbi:MAG: formylglycine-generating enzyme family protein [Gammaproteobacteria bacterium]